MTDATMLALRESLTRVLGGPQLTPARDDGRWAEDWPALADLGGADLLDVEVGAGRAGLELAVATAEEVARALHGFPAHAVLPASAARSTLADLLSTVSVAGVVVAPGLRVEDTGARSLVSGTTDTVTGVDGLTHLLVVAENGDVAVLDTAAGGVEPTPEPSLDVTRSFWRVHLDRAPALRVPDLDGSWLVAASRLLVAADSVAVTSLAVDRTVAHARERETFGGPIGRYQAVQHRLVEHAVGTQQMADLLREATVALRDDAGDAMELTVLEAFCHQRAAEVISDCIQLTGAIGFTWEYGLHFGLRRAAGNARLVGGARRARRTLAALSGW